MPDDGTVVGAGEGETASAGESERVRRYCLGCGYVLDHLPEARCPECGRGFDPDNAGTFRDLPWVSWEPALRMAKRAGLALVIAGGSVVLGVVGGLNEFEPVAYCLATVSCAAGCYGFFCVCLAVGRGHDAYEVRHPEENMRTRMIEILAILADIVFFMAGCALALLGVVMAIGVVPVVLVWIMEQGR